MARSHEAHRVGRTASAQQRRLAARDDVISLRFGRQRARVVLHLIATYFVLFSPVACAASRDYLRRVLGRPARWRDVYRHVFTFAATIHDRIYLMNGRFDLFDIRLHGETLVDDALAGGRGAFLMGAHLGSFEVVRAIGRTHPDLRVVAMAERTRARSTRRSPR